MSFSTVYKTGLLTIALFCSILTVGFAQSYSDYDYIENTSTSLINPERGFYKHTETSSPSYSQLRVSNLQSYRSQGFSLILRLFYLTEFVTSDISETYLKNMQSDFNAMRAAGVKAVVRFAYTKKSTAPYGDASPEWTTRHIAQLKNVLHANADVISVVQVGFIGAWGEWYYTDHFGTGAISEAHWTHRRNLVYNLLNAVPKSRFVQLRTPSQKMRITGVNTPLTSEEAFNLSDISRMAHHNDCFLASANDVGTYNTSTITAEKAYLEEETKYLPMGGETCGVSVPYSQCPNAVAEMQRFHWSYLNRDYHGSVLTSWINDGCMDDVLKKLGYRIILKRANLQQASKPNGVANFSLTLINDGWAVPYNKRDVELVLRNKSNNKEYVLALNEDPRRWPLGEEFTIQVSAGLPQNIQEGDYDILLNLPDPEPSIKNDPNYSIQLANENTWESTTGYNKLNHTFTVSSSANVPTYVGSSYFLSNLMLQESKKINVDGNASDWADIESTFENELVRFKMYTSQDSVFFLTEDKNSPSTFLQLAIALPGPNNSISTNPFSFIAYGYGIIEYGRPLSDFNAATNGLDSLDFAFVIGNLTIPTSALAKLLRFPVPLVMGHPLKATSSGSTVHLYWANNVQPTSRVIQRSDDRGVTFKTIGIVSASEFSFTDAVEGDTILYRSYQISENLDAVSPISETIVVPLSLKPAYYTYSRDTDISEWSIVQPSFTYQNASHFLAARFQITNDSLHIAFENSNPTNYSIYLDWDNDGSTGTTGAEYILRNNTVTASNDNVIASYEHKTTNSQYEIAIPLSVFAPLTKDATISITLKLLDLSIEKQFTFQRIPPAGIVSGLLVENSTLQPETMLNVSWNYCEDCSGYRVDRSLDGVTFETISHKSRNTITTHFDTNLTAGQVYTYRVSGYNDLGVVFNTETKSLATKLILAAEKNTTDGSVYPNPTQGPVFIKTMKQATSFNLFDAKGNAVKASVVQAENGYISFDITHLPAGLYILKGDDYATYRIIKQ